MRTHPSWEPHRGLFLRLIRLAFLNLRTGPSLPSSFEPAIGTTSAFAEPNYLSPFLDLTNFVPSAFF